MLQAQIYETLTQLFRDVFMRDDLVLDPSLTPDGVAGWDSFKQIEIIVATEDRFKIKLHAGDLDKLTNVGELVQVIASKLTFVGGSELEHAPDTLRDLS